MHTFSGYLGICCSALLLLTPCPPASSCEKSLQETRHDCIFPAMGVEFRVTYYAPADAGIAINRKIKQRIAQIENSLSDYKTTSELSRFCQSSPHRTPQSVSCDFWELSRTSQAISEKTEGAFDITVGNLSHLWRMARKRNRLPTSEKIRAARELTGFRKLEIHPNQKLRLTQSGMKLDFGGIAKGYSADQIICLLKQHRIQSALVDAGGDICASNPPPGKSHWKVRIRDTQTESEVTERVHLKLANAAVATSGDLNQYLTVKGKKHSHIIDPRTGQATTNISMVTVIAPNATLADAYASAVSVAGVTQGLALIENLADTDCLILAHSRNSGEPIERFTSGNWQRSAGQNQQANPK